MPEPVDIVDDYQDQSEPGNGRVDWDAVDQIVAARVKDQEYRQKIERDAIRYQGMQEFKQLVAGGATKAEALQRTADKIYADNPAGFGAAVRYNDPRPIQPTPPRTKLGGNGSIYMEGKPGEQWKSVSPPRPTRPPPPKAIPRSDWKIAESEYDDARDNLKKARGMDQNNKKQIAEKDLAIQQAKLNVDKKLQVLRDLEKTPEQIEGERRNQYNSPQETSFREKARAKLLEQGVEVNEPPDEPKMIYEEIPDKPKYPEGKRLRDKETGKTFVVKNGIPVEE